MTDRLQRALELGLSWSITALWHAAISHHGRLRSGSRANDIKN
ncbi:MAG: hypothetical protein ACLT4C_10575 [Butyricicoccus sp.]